jgi:hypothetical protein
MKKIELYEFNNLKLICDVSQYQPIVTKVTGSLFIYLTRLISSQSDVCYYPNSVEYSGSKHLFTLPITVQYHNDEGDILKIINKRVDAIRKTIIHMKFESNHMKFIARTLKTYKIDPLNFLQLTYFLNDGSELIYEPIELHLPDIPNFTIREHKYPSGNFRHIEYIDPLLNDYGLYIGLCKPFSEMGYSYNSLHIYEHMMTLGWKKLNEKDVLELNGATFPTGMCYLYNIHKTKKSLKTYAREYVKFHSKTKNPEYWKHDLMNDLKRETIRTYSETQSSKSLKDFARTDPSIYENMIYSIEPFVKYSNDEYTILTVSPEKIDFKFDHYLNDKHITPNVQYRTYDSLPLAAIRNTNELVIINKKDLTEELYNRYSVLFGVDCVALCLDDYNRECEHLNTVLLFILKNKIDVIKAFLKDKAMPIHNSAFNNIDVYCNYSYDDFDDNEITNV